MAYDFHKCLCHLNLINVLLLFVYYPLWVRSSLLILLLKYSIYRSEHSELSCCLGCLHFTSECWFKLKSFLCWSRFLLEHPSRHQLMAQALGPCHLSDRQGRRLGHSISAWPSPRYRQHLGSKSGKGRYLFLSLFILASRWKI